MEREEEPDDGELSSSYWNKRTPKIRLNFKKRSHTRAAFKPQTTDKIQTLHDAGKAHPDPRSKTGPLWTSGAHRRCRKNLRASARRGETPLRMPSRDHGEYERPLLYSLTLTKFMESLTIPA
jgi:hypothetical protein